MDDLGVPLLRRTPHSPSPSPGTGARPRRSSSVPVAGGRKPRGRVGKPWFPIGKWSAIGGFSPWNVGLQEATKPFSIYICSSTLMWSMCARLHVRKLILLCTSIPHTKVFSNKILESWWLTQRHSRTRTVFGKAIAKPSHLCGKQ